MATIGTFNKNGEGFTGIIRTLAFTASVTIAPVTRKRGEKSPDYRLYVQSSGPAEIGAAWERSFEGVAYLSVRIDDPIFPTAINCRLIQADDEDGYSLTWERQRPRD